MKFIIVLLSVLLFTGCSPKAIDDLRDPELTTGCVVVEGIVTFDSYLDTTKGNVELCKVKCSEVLPENFYYEYENDRTGCHVVVSDTEMLPDSKPSSLSEVKSLSDIKRLSDIGE